MKYLSLLTLPLYLLDQLTKWLVLARFELHESRVVVPGLFNLVHVTNTGAAFGMMKDNNAFFIALSTLVGVGLLVFWFRGAFADIGSRIAVALLLAGILGNLTDRIVHGQVIDFLDFYIGANHWPAFNVADSCICLAAALFFLAAFRDPKTAH